MILYFTVALGQRLYDASNRGDICHVQRLLQAGTDPGFYQDECHEMHALHVAAGRGMCDCVELLLKYGAEVNIKSGNGNTPLHQAAKCGHLNVVERLCQSAGLELIGEKNKDNLTASQLAVAKGHLHVADYIHKSKGRKYMLWCTFLALLTCQSARLIT